MKPAPANWIGQAAGGLAVALLLAGCEAPPEAAPAPVAKADPRTRGDPGDPLLDEAAVAAYMRVGAYPSASRVVQPAGGKGVCGAARRQQFIYTGERKLVLESDLSPADFAKLYLAWCGAGDRV